MSAKEAVRRILDKLPEDSTFEDIQYHIYVREKISRAVEDIEQGRVLEHEDVKQRLEKWLGD